MRDRFESDRAFELWKQMPDHDPQEAPHPEHYEKRLRVHLFCDGAVAEYKPKYPHYWGWLAMGCLLINPWGQPLAKKGEPRGKGYIHDAEWDAVLEGARLAHDKAPYGRDSVVVLHTDSSYVYGGLVRQEVYKTAHVRAAKKTLELLSGFEAYSVEPRSSANYGIRNAESQALKALSDMVGEDLAGKRGSRGAAYAEEAAWNPFEGEEDGWPVM